MNGSVKLNMCVFHIAKVLLNYTPTILNCILPKTKKYIGCKLFTKSQSKSYFEERGRCFGTPTQGMIDDFFVFKVIDRRWTNNDHRNPTIDGYRLKLPHKYLRLSS